MFVEDRIIESFEVQTEFATYLESSLTLMPTKKIPIGRTFVLEFSIPACGQSSNESVNVGCSKLQSSNITVAWSYR